MVVKAVADEKNRIKRKDLINHITMRFVRSFLWYAIGGSNPGHPD